MRKADWPAGPRLVPQPSQWNLRLKPRLGPRGFKEVLMTTEERETVSLIGSDKVEGTSVFGARETQIG